MAGQFPIQTTQRSLPGRGPGAFGFTGAMAEGAAIQEFGGALVGVGIVENRIQADIELAEALGADEQAMNDLAFRLEKNTDPHTYQEELNKTLAEIQSRHIKNGLAARKHAEMVKEDMIPWMQDAVQKATRLRVISNFEATLFRAETEAIQTGRMAKFQVLLAEGVTAGYIAEDKATKKMFKTQHDMERRLATEFAMENPDGFLEFFVKDSKIEGYDNLTPDDVQDLRQIAQGQQAFNQRNLLAIQDEVGRKMLVSLWKGELTDLNEITDALDKGFISTAMAKSLRQALIQPQPVPPAEQLAAEAFVRDTINRYNAGDITKQEALEVLYSKAGVLGQAKGSSLLDKLYDAPDKRLAEMKREGKSLMEEYVRTRDKFTGYFTDNKKEIMGTAEAVLLLDIEIDKAERAGKPLGRRDIMIKAMEIGQQVRSKIDKMGKKDVPVVPVELGQDVLAPTDKSAAVGTAAIAPDGSVWGTHNGDGTITLNDYGVMALLDAASNNEAEARKLAAQHGFRIPK